MLSEVIPAVRQRGQGSLLSTHDAVRELGLRDGLMYAEAQTLLLNYDLVDARLYMHDTLSQGHSINAYKRVVPRLGGHVWQPYKTVKDQEQSSQITDLCGNGPRASSRRSEVPLGGTRGKFPSNH